MIEKPQASDPSVLAKAKTIHFIGIGGIGMSALAELLLGQGKKVTGSDVKGSPIVDRLQARGATINIGHTADAVAGAELVVATSAVGSDNPELVEANLQRLPVVKRAELLGWLMSESYGIAIAGTHGKTTTTAMVAYLLYQSGLDPTALIGGEPLDFESHGLLGHSQYLVAEADEFDRSFLQLWPKVAVITSVEEDHLDCYADMDDIARTFTEFASRVPSDGMLITCVEDPILQSMKLSVPRQSYGSSDVADWMLTDCVPVRPFGTHFDFTSPGGSVHQCNLRLSGRHYALNALAAVAVAAQVGIRPGMAASALSYFRGTRRRYELVGEAGGVTIIDDYAHHPTAVRATLGAARERHSGTIWCVFQPHTVNRTERLLSQFAAAFSDADRVLVLPIYQPAGREEGEAVSSRDLLAKMGHAGARCVGSLPEASALLESEIGRGDLVITMGAGDVHKVGEHVLCRLKKKESKE